jgi:hypothetical protein
VQAALIFPIRVTWPAGHRLLVLLHIQDLWDVKTCRLVNTDVSGVLLLYSASSSSEGTSNRILDVSFLRTPGDLYKVLRYVIPVGKSRLKLHEGRSKGWSCHSCVTTRSLKPLYYYQPKPLWNLKGRFWQRPLLVVTDTGNPHVIRVYTRNRRRTSCVCVCVCVCLCVCPAR